MIKYLVYLFISVLLFCNTVSYAASTTVKLYQIKKTDLNSLNPLQIGNQSVLDTNLGFRMWGGKDSVGTVTKFLAKDRQARVTGLRSDTSYTNIDTAKQYRAPLAIFDSARISKLAGVARMTADTLKVDSCLQLPLRTADCATNGSMWYSETHGGVHSNEGGVVGDLPRVLFIQQNTVLDSNSTVETSLIGTSPIYTLDSFPADYFQIGTTHRWQMSGVYTTKATSAGTLTIRVYANSTVIASVVVTLDNNEVNQPWALSGTNTCIDTGTTGKFRLFSGWQHDIAGVRHNDGIITADAGTTVNTNVKILPRFTFQLGTADVANKIKSTQFIIEELH